ncbi:MAG: hypothetical protein KDD40_10605, partial [Bdellovibrionales bacterium]|nr:hypothetical protein [Bdellovibrionales bacterium]
MHFFTFFLYLLSIGWCIELHADEAKLCQEQLIEQIIQPKTRQNAIVELRTKYQLKSQKLKAKFQRELHSEAINYDIVIIGGGPATISFIAGVRAANPLLKILVIDESDTLAPAFEGPGKALIFNSMTIYDEIEPINAHHFPNHFLQLLDFYDFIDNSKKYPTGEDISALTWSQFAHLNTDLLLQTRAVGLNVIDNESPIKVLTNDNLYVRAKAVVLATGQGHTNIQFLNAREQA